MVNNTKKHEKHIFRKTNKNRGGKKSSNSKNADKVFILTPKQEKKLYKLSKLLASTPLTEKEILDKYNKFCDQEMAVISMTLLKEDWRKNYDHLYENPSMPLPLSPHYEKIVKNFKEVIASKKKSISAKGGYYDNRIHNDESVKKIINLFNYIASDTGRNTKIRETVISRFMLILRLSSLRNSQIVWPELNERNNLAYTNAMILFITNNISFDVFTLLKVPQPYNLTTAEKRSYGVFVTGLNLADLTPEIINEIKIYTGPTSINTHNLTSTPLIEFGLLGVQGALSPWRFNRINETYNTNFTIKPDLNNFLNGLHGESAPSNQKSQCVLLSVILYVISKLSENDIDNSIVNESEIYDTDGNFKEQAFKNKIYLSSDLANKIYHYEHKTEVGNFYENVCKSGTNDVIPYNALISFNINPDNTYVHKSFVSSIKPEIKELINDIFSILRLNNSGIILPKTFVVGELSPNIIKYDRSRLPKSDFKFLQSDNIYKTVTDTNAKYGTVEPEIIDNAIPAYTGINIRLDGLSVASICNKVSTMSYLAYLPTYHVATYNLGEPDLKYFGAYDPDPDCIRLTNVPELTINNKNLRELGNTALDRRLKENYKYSYHRIHVWINKQSKLIYFAIRGTHSSRDWKHSDYLVARGEGHRMDRVDIIDDVLRQVYSDMVGIWNLGPDARPFYKLIITGHSLGGNLTNITKVITHKNNLYGFTDTFTNGFPISCQPYYSSNDHSDDHFNILNWAFSQDEGLVLNVEHDGAAELLITKAKANKISKNLTIFEATRTSKQKPPAFLSFSIINTILYMGFTHSLYNFFGKTTWENIMNHHTKQQLLINGDVNQTPNVCTGKLINNYTTSDGSRGTIESTYIKYGDYEGDSNNLIETNNFILTTNLAVEFNCQLPDKNVNI